MCRRVLTVFSAWNPDFALGEKLLNSAKRLAHLLILDPPRVISKVRQEFHDYSWASWAACLPVSTGGSRRANASHRQGSGLHLEPVVINPDREKNRCRRQGQADGERASAEDEDCDTAENIGDGFH